MSATAARRWPRRRGGEVSVLGRVEPTTVLIAMVTVAVFGLRLSQLHQSLLGDEVSTLQDVVGRSLGSVLGTVHTGAENSPPLFFVLAWASAKLGDPTVWIRLPSLLLGTATVPLIYALGRETVGRIPGLVGAAIVAVSPFSLYYGIEARPYATMAFFVTLSTLALLRAVGSGSYRWWLAYALATAAAAYTHYTAIFVLVVQGAWSLWVCRDRLRVPLLANVLPVLLYIPWLPQIRGKELGVIGLLEPLNVHNVLIDVLRPIPGYPYASIRAIPTIAGYAVVAGCAALGLIAFAYRWRQAGHEPGRVPRLALVALLAIATPIGLLLYSIVGTDLWIARGLYASVPAAALVLGALLCALPRLARPVAVAAVLVTLLAGTIRAMTPGWARPPFRPAAAYLDRVAAPRDPIIFYPSFLTWDIVSQFKRRHPVMASSPGQWRTVPPGGAAYLVIDNKYAQALRISTPHPPGFVLTGRRPYPSHLWSFTLLSYRALNPGSHTPSRTRTA